MEKVIIRRDGEQIETEQKLTIFGGEMGKGQSAEVQKIQMNKIKLGGNSRLSSMSSEELSGLMQSIKKVGLLQPIGVAKNGNGYEVCYGNRRFMACSRLGHSHIVAVIHEKKEDISIKNLTENVQRRNISLEEIGRFVTLLKEEGLSYAEVAVRLGTSKKYVTDCLAAFSKVPKEYRKDLEVNVSKDNKTKRMPGKISISVAREIITAGKNYNLSADQTKSLFKAAKSEDSFTKENISKYAGAIKNGKKDFINSVNPVKHFSVNIILDEAEYDALVDKHITNGPFKSISKLILSILKGEKDVKLKTVKNY